MALTSRHRLQDSQKPQGFSDLARKSAICVYLLGQENFVHIENNKSETFGVQKTSIFGEHN